MRDYGAIKTICGFAAGLCVAGAIFRLDPSTDIPAWGLAAVGLAMLAIAWAANPEERKKK